MTRQKAELLLAAVIIARSTSYLFMKIGMNSLEPFNLMGLRFLTAFGILLLLFHRRFLRLDRKTFFYGLLLGGTLFAVMSAEMYGLKTTDSSTTSFLENTAIVIVPLIQILLSRRLPPLSSLFCTAITFCGIALLTLKGGSLSFTTGEWLCMLAAVLYAVLILLTDRLSHLADPLLMGILQVGFVGVFGAVAAFLFETPHMPASGTEWGIILILAIVCSAFGFTLQPVAQKGTTAERASLFCALTPASAAILGYVFLHEDLSGQRLAGFALILIGILFSQCIPLIQKRKQNVPS